MPLSDLKIRALQPSEKRYRVADEKGLALLVMPNGSKLWRLRYRDAEGKEQTISLGAYPDISLKAARALAEAHRVGIRGGDDPAAAKRAKRAARNAPRPETITFGQVAQAWIDANRSGWAPSNVTRIEANFANDILPLLSKVPIREVTWRDNIKPVVEAVEARGAIDTARKTLQRIAGVFKFAMADDLVESNPAVGRTAVMQRRPKPKPMRAIVEPTRLGEALRIITRHRGSYTVRAALQLAFHLPVRPGELRQMRWDEIDWEGGVWNIPAARMKKRMPLAVPLSKQARAMLRDLERYNGRSEFVFPKRGGGIGCMSENTVNQALKALGLHGEMSGHGVRSSFSTMMHDRGWLSDAIERQLAHVEQDAVKRAYDRGDHWDTRVQMMQSWSDLLDKLRDADNVIRLPMRMA